MTSLADEKVRSPVATAPVTTAAERTSEIVTEQSEGILRIQFNRPARENALTSNMYSGVADLLNAAAEDAGIRIVLLHGAGDSFTAGNDLEDFMRNPPKPGDRVQERFVTALINFDKPVIAAVHGAAVGSGTTMLAHCDFVYAAESTRFQLPFVNLAVAPELGLVTRIVSDDRLLATAIETAQILAGKLLSGGRASSPSRRCALRPRSSALAWPRKRHAKPFPRSWRNGGQTSPISTLRPVRAG